MRAILAPHGDRVRLEVLPYGPPRAGIALPLSPPPPVPARPAAVSVPRYVTMANPRRCIRRARVRIAARPGQDAVTSLTVKANGRRRTISGARLRAPLEVRLTRRQTVVEVTVRLRGGRSGTRAVAFTRCG